MIEGAKHNLQAREEATFSRTAPEIEYRITISDVVF